MTFSQYELKKLSVVLSVEHLHLLSDGLPVGQDVAQVPGAQHIPQGGGGQQPGGPAVVVHVGHGVDGVLHLVVHDGVDKHRHGVLGQDLEYKSVLISFY